MSRTVIFMVSLAAACAVACGGKAMDLGDGTGAEPPLAPPTAPDAGFSVERACRAHGGPPMRDVDPATIVRVLPGRWAHCPDPPQMVNGSSYSYPGPFWRAADAAIELTWDDARKAGRWTAYRFAADGSYEPVPGEDGSGTWALVSEGPFGGGPRVVFNDAGHSQYLSKMFIESNPTRFFWEWNSHHHVFAKLPDGAAR